MRWPRLRSLMRALGSRRAVERDLSDELRFHLDARAEDLARRRNLPLDEARRLASLEFGSIGKYTEESREALGLRFVDVLSSDLRYSLRQLRRYPGFTAAAVLTIALGTGPNAAIATIVSTIFRPLPVPDANGIAVLATAVEGNRRVRQRLAYPDLLDYRQSAAAFSDIAAWELNPVGVTADGRTDRVIATIVSGNYFSMLRLEPAAGRLIAPADGELGGGEAIAVLSHSYWTRRFGADPSVVGRDVRIDGRLFTVVGVAPAAFHGTFALLSSDVFLPLELFQSRERLANRDILSVRAIARLQPKTTIEQARAAIETVAARLERDHRSTNAGRRVRVYAERLARPEPQNESQGLVVAGMFLMLVGMVLLIACGNVLGLFLSRALGRRREMAIRAAIGASRWDLVRVCLVESLIVGLMGTAAGAAAGIAATRGFAAVAATPGFPLFLDLRVDWQIVAYLAALLTVSTLTIGLLPAVRASRVDARVDLGAWQTAVGGRRQWIRKTLAAAQMATSVVLLVVCGLFVRSLQRVQSVDLGFDGTRVLLTSVDAAAAGYDAPRVRSFYAALDAALEAMPEVEAAGASVFVPFGTGNSTPYVARAGQPAPSGTTGLQTDAHAVTGDYFQAIGTPLLRGRSFTSADVPGSTPVAVVNEAMAGRLWPGEDPIGQRFRTNADPQVWLEVVGIVPNARYRRPEVGGPAAPRFFTALDQADAGARTLHVRSRTESPETLAPAVQAAIRRLAPDVPVHDVLTLERQVHDSGGGFGSAKAAALVTGLLGALALVLALVGTYGVLSFTIRARTREIGIRVALGLPPARVFRMVLWESWRIAIAAVAIGLTIGVAAGGAMQGFLYGVVPHDPAALVAVAALMAAVSTVVGLLPARRAARVNPIETFRCE